MNSRTSDLPEYIIFREMDQMTWQDNRKWCELVSKGEETISLDFPVVNTCLRGLSITRYAARALRHLMQKVTFGELIKNARLYPSEISLWSFLRSSALGEHTKANIYALVASTGFVNIRMPSRIEIVNERRQTIGSLYLLTKVLPTDILRRLAWALVPTLITDDPEDDAFDDGFIGYANCPCCNPHLYYIEREAERLIQELELDDYSYHRRIREGRACDPHDYYAREDMRERRRKSRAKANRKCTKKKKRKSKQLLVKKRRQLKQDACDFQDYLTK